MRRLSYRRGLTRLYLLLAGAWVLWIILILPCRISDGLKTVEIQEYVSCQDRARTVQDEKRCEQPRHQYGLNIWQNAYDGNMEGLWLGGWFVNLLLLSLVPSVFVYGLLRFALWGCVRLARWLWQGFTPDSVG